MLAMFLIVVSGAGWAIWRAGRQVSHSIPRTNDDMIFF